MDKFIQKSAALKIGDSFQDYLGYLRQKGLAEKTVNEHRRFLFGALSHAVAFPDKKISDLKLTDVASVIESGRRHGEYGSQRAVVTLRQYLKYLKESGLQLPFDWRDIEVPKVPEKEIDYLSASELKQLLRAIPLGNICGLRTRALLETLYSTGLRIFEALSITRDQIPWQIRELKIKGKGGEEGVVYFTKRSLYWLKRYLNTLAVKGAREFTRASGGSFKGLAGSKKFSAFFLEHELKISKFMCSLEAALKKRNSRLLFWKSQKELRALHLRVANPRARSERIPVIPDGLFSVPVERRPEHFFLEADRGTMGLPEIAKKILGYIEFYRRGIHREIFKLPYFRVLLVTTTQQRRKKMMVELRKISHCQNMFLFTLWAHISPLSILERIWLKCRGEEVSLLD